MEQLVGRIETFDNFRFTKVQCHFKKYNQYYFEWEKKSHDSGKNWQLAWEDLFKIVVVGGVYTKEEMWSMLTFPPFNFQKFLEKLETVK